MKVLKAQLILMSLVLCIATMFGVERNKEKGGSFTFTKVDLSLLDQADLLDAKLEREGMVYHEGDIEAYINQVGRAMLPSGTAPERVKWEFRVVRDPMPNAFALPNGSIYATTGLISKLDDEDNWLVCLHTRSLTLRTGTRIWHTGTPGRSPKLLVLSLTGQDLPQVAPRGERQYRPLASWRQSSQEPLSSVTTGSLSERQIFTRTVNWLRAIMTQTNWSTRFAYWSAWMRRTSIRSITITQELEDRIAYMLSLISSKPPILIPPDLLAARRMKYLTLTERVDREDVHLAILSHQPRTGLARATKLLNSTPI